MKNQSSLIQKYINAAIANGEAVKVGNHRVANREYAKLTRIYRKLEKDHSLANTIINELLQNPNHLVFGWASAHALGLNISVDKAEKLLDEITKMSGIGILRLDAEMTLKEWRRKRKLTF